MSWGGNPPPYNPGYGAAPAAAYGQQPASAPMYGAPPPQHGYQAPPLQQAYGAPPSQQAYGAPPPQSYGAPPPQGYGATPHQQTAPPPHHGYSAPQPGYGGAPPPQQYSNPYGGQQGYGVPAGPPGGGDPTLWHWFQAVDADHSGQITSQELQTALVNGNWSNFNPETCRLMIGMFDKDKNGTICFKEFEALWKYIQEWKQCFDRFDTDRSGNMDANELSTAFRTFGYQLSAAFSHMIVQKFNKTDRTKINFDDFIQCCVMLRSLTDAFRKKDTTQTGNIRVHYEEFLEMVLENSP